MKRRKFFNKGLKSLALFSFAANVPVIHAASVMARSPLACLSAFVDTLIPLDSTPSASQLGIQTRLVEHAKTVENYSRLLELGCQWLNMQAQSIYGVPFDGLSSVQREAIVTMAETSPHQSIPKMFFDRVLSDLFALYYAHPGSWPGLGIDSPPQPKGYVRYAQRP